MHPFLHPFLHRMRRRLRLVWAWATLAWVAPAITAAALAVVLVGWLWPWAWPEPVAALVVVTVLGAVGAWAVVQRLPLPVVARAADRGLATGDSFGAALQFEDLDGAFGQRIRDRAEHLASGASPGTAAPLPPEGRRWAVGAVLGVAALALAVAPNPQDGVRAEQARIDAVLEAVADEIEEQSGDLAAAPGTDALARELAALTGALRHADDLETARQALADAQAALDAARPDNFASQRAAVEGLDRSVGQRSLLESAPTTIGAARQLADLAADLEGLTGEERQALAERLADLAATQEAGNPEVAEALADAAATLAAGDVTGARAALGEAALAQGRSSAAVSTQLAADAVAAQLAQTQAALQGQSQGQGPPNACGRS